MVDKLTKTTDVYTLQNKVNEVIDNLGSGGSITIDSELSTTSKNPVQNKVIADVLSNVIKKDGGSTSQTISLSGGSGTTPLAVKSRSASSSYISFSSSGAWLGSIGVNSSKKPVFYNGTDYTLATTDDIPDISSKQDTLVSGTNIKTVNNTSLLGSGNITIEGGGSSRNIGEIVASTIPLTDAGLHLLDGALIQGSGVYSAFVTYIAGLVSTYPDLFTTEANWQSAISQYGVCGKFVYDSTNNTVRLPKYSNKIFTGEGTAPVVGNGVTLGLSGYNGANSGLVAGDNGEVGLIGTQYGTNSGTLFGGVQIGSAVAYTVGVTTDPTKSGLIADLSNITTSLDGYYYIVVANSTKTNIQVDIDEIATDLNGKADTGLSNVPTSKGILTESYKNGSSWYRVYADGWCEQGGAWGTSTGAWASANVTFLKPFVNNYYALFVQGNWSDGASSSCTVTSRSGTGFTGTYANNLYSVMPSLWRACGYIR